MKQFDNRNDGQATPVPYRLPPTHKKAKAGCWPVALLILLSLALLGCGIAEGVRKFAEPVDAAVCKFDCGWAGLEFGSYDYETDSCVGRGADNNEVKLYGLDRGEE